MNAKPREIKELQGTLEKHRDNPDSPRPTDPVGDWPLKAPDRHTKTLFEKLKNDGLIPEGVAKSTDTIAVALLASLLAKFEMDAMTGADMTALMSLLGRFGMTPVDRQRVTSDVRQKAQEKAEKENPFAEFKPKVVAGGKSQRC